VADGAWATLQKMAADGVPVKQRVFGRRGERVREELPDGRFRSALRPLCEDELGARRADRERDPITNVRLRDCVFSGIQQDSEIEYVEGLSLRGVVVNGEPMTR
jgi:hypothetical protein